MGSFRVHCFITRTKYSDDKTTMMTAFARYARIAKRVKSLNLIEMNPTCRLTLSDFFCKLVRLSLFSKKIDLSRRPRRAASIICKQVRNYLNSNENCKPRSGQHWTIEGLGLKKLFTICIPDNNHYDSKLNGTFGDELVCDDDDDLSVKQREQQLVLLYEAGFRREDLDEMEGLLRATSGEMLPLNLLQKIINSFSHDVSRQMGLRMLRQDNRQSQLARNKTHLMSLKPTSNEQPARLALLLALPGRERGDFASSVLRHSDTNTHSKHANNAYAHENHSNNHHNDHNHNHLYDHPPRHVLVDLACLVNSNLATSYILY